MTLAIHQMGRYYRQRIHPILSGRVQVLEQPCFIAWDVQVVSVERLDKFVAVVGRVAGLDPSWVRFVTLWRLLEECSGLRQSELESGDLLLQEPACQRHLAQGLRLAAGVIRGGYGLYAS